MVREGNIKLTLSIDKKILEEYKKYCKNKGEILSKKIENFMRDSLSKK